MITPAYPWRLRLVHEGYASIRVERRGAWVRFDPYDAPAPGQLSVLTWSELERSRGVLAAMDAGDRPTVLTSPPLREWLRGKGAVDDRDPDGVVEELRFEAEPYKPIPYATPPEAARKLRAAVLNPAHAAMRVRKRLEQPRGTQPLLVQVTLPDGGRLLHLNCSLHDGTDAEWLRRVQGRFHGADWLLVGVDYEQDEAVIEGVPGFGARTVMITDLVNDVRRDIGLPCGILTPVVDALASRGVDAHPFVREAGQRFE